jgi:putative oxidoreductase
VSEKFESERILGGITMKYAVLPARVLFALVFILGGLGLFSHATIEYAVAQGVPLASIAVPISGVIALAGGLSVALGYKARIGAALLIVFLIPVTVMLHNFWAIPDPLMAQMQQVMFMKNVSMLGAALFIAYFGAGPVSLDARQAARPERSGLLGEHGAAALS